MGFRLTSVDGEKPIKLDKPVLLIGRSADCDVVLTASRKVSRIHCFVACVEHRVYIRDLGSTNGVWINGHRVDREQRVRVGDELSVADVRFLLEETKEPNGEHRREPKPSRIVEPDPDDSVEAQPPPRQREGLPVRNVRPAKIDRDAHQPVALPEEDDSFVVEASMMHVKPRHDDESEAVPRPPKRSKPEKGEPQPAKRAPKANHFDDEEVDDGDVYPISESDLLKSLGEEDDVDVDDNSSLDPRRRR